MVRFALLVILMSIAGSAIAQASGGFKYDPQSCKVDSHGKLYIALGHTVLAVPPNQTSNVRLLEPKLGDVRLPPPDSGEVEGCRGNPWQVSSYEFLYSFQNTLDRWSPKRKEQIRAGYVDLIALRRDRFIDGKWAGEDLNLMRSFCAGNSIREDLPNGIQACRPAGSNGEPFSDQWHAYVAQNHIYTTPLGRTLGAVCTGSQRFYQCAISYMYSLDVGVAYTLRPEYGGTRIPMDHMIELDRAIRAEIGAMIVENYKWPH